MTLPLILWHNQGRGRPIGGGGGLSLPYSVDFTALSDGNLPSAFTADTTWQISTGAAVCTPVTVGSELLTDTGLEATYTAGKCDSLRSVGSATLAEETSDIHGGSKAQKVTGVANADRIDWFPNTNITANKFYTLSCWAKKVSGSQTSRLWFRAGNDNALNYAAYPITGGWTQYITSRIGLSDLQIFGYYGQSGIGDVVIFDDGSIKQLTTTELIAMLPETSAAVTVKAGFTIADRQYQCGIIARSNSKTAPTSYLFGAMYTSSTAYRAALYKIVNGTVTHLDSGNITYAAGRLLEIRTNGTTVQLFYNNIQVGSDQTVSDAEILNNTIHGFISTGGGNSLDSFFVT